MTVVALDARRAARKPRPFARPGGVASGTVVVRFPAAAQAVAAQAIGAFGVEAPTRPPAAWLARIKRRKMLRGLLATEPLSVLQDLGYRDRGDARIEAYKPFWRA